jgi:hypothetical protein
VHDAVDPEFERDLRRVSHVFSVSKDVGTCCLIVDERACAREIEFVASWLRLGKGLKRIPAIPRQILMLRRGWGDQHKEALVGQDGTHRMEAWRAIPPHGGEKGQPHFELKDQRSADISEVGLRGGERLPRHHRITSYSPTALALAAGVGAFAWPQRRS